MILQARIIGDTLGIASAAQQLVADMKAGYISRGVTPERAAVLLSKQFGRFVYVAPAEPVTPSVPHPAIRTMYAIDAKPYDHHVYAWRAEVERRASRQRIGIVDTILQPTAAAIIGIVSETRGVSVGNMVGFSRAKRHSTPRRIAVALCRKWTTQSEPALGRLFNRDASSIHTAANDIARAVEEGGHMAADFARCDAVVRARYPKAAFRPVWGDAEAGRKRLARTRAQSKGVYS
jgi:hypothetical protein